MSLTEKGVVITRAAHQYPEFATLLQEAGAVPYAYPCIDIVSEFPSADVEENKFDWLVLTSQNTVHALPNALGASRIAAIGAQTAELAQQKFGIDVCLVSEMGDISKQSICLPQGDLADDSMANQLTARGALVTRIQAYRTVMGSGGVDLLSLCKAKKVHAICFASGSAVYNFQKRFKEEGGLKHHLDGVCIATIGPSTERQAKRAGLRVDLVAQVQSSQGLVDALKGAC